MKWAWLLQSKVTEPPFTPFTAYHDGWLIDGKPIDNPSAKVPEPFVTNHIKYGESRVDKPPDTSTE